MKVTTEKIPSADSTGAPYVAGNFALLKSEVTAFELEVVGRVPEELNGRFLRIGPNPIDKLDLVRLVRYHWFAAAVWRMACACTVARRTGSAVASSLIGRLPKF